MVLELYLIFSNGTDKKKGKGHIISVWFSPVSVYLFNCFTLPHVKWINMKTFNFPSYSDGICHKRCTCALFLPGKHHRNLMHFNPPKSYKLNLIKNVIFVLQNGWKWVNSNSKFNQYKYITNYLRSKKGNIKSNWHQLIIPKCYKVKCKAKILILRQ